MKRRAITIIVMVILMIILIFWNLNLGSSQMSVSEVLSILSGKMQDTTEYKVIWSIRLPRAIAAVLLGGALSVSGFLLQTFFSNPIAGPYILGISSGAKLVVALTMISCMNAGISISSLGMVGAAFAGSLASMGLVLLLSFRVRNMSMLIVCGIMIGYICSAITDFCVTFANDSNIVNLHNWSMGSLAGINWTDIRVMTVIIVVAVIASFLMAKPISAYQMGEAYARNMGVNIRMLRVLLIMFSSLLAACVTAFAGPISFVGVAVPHLVKTASGTAKPLILVPSCFIGGAAITLLCDGIAREMFAPTEISVSSVTAVFLVPVVLVMMIKRQRSRA